MFVCEERCPESVDKDFFAAALQLNATPAENKLLRSGGKKGRFGAKQ